MVLGISRIAFRLRDWFIFTWQSLEILNLFNTFTLKQIFWKTKTLLNKLEDRFFVESTKSESTTFSCKTDLSEANDKTNRMGSIKWTYHKERSFVSNYFIFKNLLQRIDLMYQLPKCPFILSVSAWVLSEDAFSLWVFLKQFFFPLRQNELIKSFSEDAWSPFSLSSISDSISTSDIPHFFLFFYDYHLISLVL